MLASFTKISGRFMVPSHNVRFFPKNSISSVGYVYGTYEDKNGPVLTEHSQCLDKESSGNFSKLLSYGGPLKEGKSRILYGVSETVPLAVAVGLGKKSRDPEPLEEHDTTKEAIRSAVAAGCNALRGIDVTKVIVDPCGDHEAAGEGALLSLFKYEDMKSNKKPTVEVDCLDPNSDWLRGYKLAEGQNIARRLMEAPANIMTPTNFAQEAVNYLEPLGVTVQVRTKEWAQSFNMNSFLSVSKGSDEPPVFLELTYDGGKSDQKPLALVGKGITFDSGGISLKPSNAMEDMKADMGGAACVVGAFFGIASLKLPINVKGFIPLCENMPNGSANKPGDVVIASNGKSIQIDNTDAEGRLILADALHYASQHQPSAIIDLATLTGAMRSALGTSATGVFTTSPLLFEKLHKAGFYTGDRVWKMPLFKQHTQQVTQHGIADVHNLGKYAKQAGASLAAAFLKEFVTCDEWMHLDIAGVMENSDQVTYIGKGMTGRPTRTIVQLASDLCQ